MEPQQQTVRREASVSGFWLVVVIACAFGSGFEFARSVEFSPNGFASVANVQLGGTLVSIILMIVAFGLHRRLVKINRARS